MEPPETIQPEPEDQVMEDEAPKETPDSELEVI